MPNTHAGIPGGQLEIYREHLICTPEATVEGNVKEMCLPPEGLSRFLNIFGSIPLDKQQLMPKYWDTEGRSRDSELVPPYSVNHHRYGISYFQLMDATPSSTSICLPLSMYPQIRS